MSVIFGNIWGLLGLLCIIPLVIAYLIKPRDVDKTIPSLMFLMRKKKQMRPSSFFKKFIHDPLFLLQLLIIILIAFSLAQPIVNYKADVLSKNMVLVIDASASSQYNEGFGTRFSKSVEMAKEYLGKETTIILAKDIPEIVLEKGTKREAEVLLDRLEPRATSTNIGDAILLADRVLHNQNGRVIVFSDFNENNGADVEIAKNLLRSKGNMVELIQIGEDKKNIGIVSMDLEGSKVSVYVKNYNVDIEEVEVKVDNQVKTIDVPESYTESVIFYLDSGKKEITLDVSDDFALDNKAYVSLPEQKDIDVLLISNNVSAFIQAGLLAQDGLSLEVSRPPVVSQNSFDIYVIEDIEADQIISGTFEDILEKVEKGASVIVFSQKDSSAIDYKGLVGVEFIERRNFGQVINEQMLSISKDIEFGNVEEFFACEASGDSIVIASALISGLVDEKYPLITYQEKGEGYLVYIGIEEEHNDFHYDPQYPIFLYNLISFVTEQKTSAELNKKAASLIIDNEVLDKVGFYDIEEDIFSVNVIDSRESDPYVEEIGIDSEEFEFVKIKQDVELELERWLLAMAFLLFLYEVWYVKKRGDL
jgi:hypothetical protein